MLINISNHPSAKWEGEQAAAARADFGRVLDVAFPAVPVGELDSFEFLVAATVAAADAAMTAAGEESLLNVSYHVQGEMGLTFALVARLAGLDRVRYSCKVYHSTTERVVVETAAGKVSQFRFGGFRQYRFAPAPGTAARQGAAVAEVGFGSIGR